MTASDFDRDHDVIFLLTFGRSPYMRRLSGLIRSGGERVICCALTWPPRMEQPPQRTTKRWTIASATILRFVRAWDVVHLGSSGYFSLGFAVVASTHSGKPSRANRKSGASAGLVTSYPPKWPTEKMYSSHVRVEMTRGLDPLRVWLTIAVCAFCANGARRRARVCRTHRQILCRASRHLTPMPHSLLHMSHVDMLIMCAL